MPGKKQQWKKQINGIEGLFWKQTASLSYFARSIPQVCHTPQNWVSGWNGNVSCVQNNEVSMHWKIFLPISWRNLRCWGLDCWRSLREKKKECPKLIGPLQIQAGPGTRQGWRSGDPNHPNGAKCPSALAERGGPLSTSFSQACPSEGDRHATKSLSMPSFSWKATGKKKRKKETGLKRLQETLRKPRDLMNPMKMIYVSAMTTMNCLCECRNNIVSRSQREKKKRKCLVMTGSFAPEKSSKIKNTSCKLMQPKLYLLPL